MVRVWSKKIVCLYTGSNGFPAGDAYTNRVLSLAKGLISVGNEVSILIIYPGRKSGVGSKEGIYDGVPFKYLTPLETAKSDIKKKLIGVSGIANACFQILTRYKDTDAIISFSESYLQNIIISIFAHLNKILFIRETNEFPGILLNGSSTDISGINKVIIRTSLKQLDGLICISKRLKDYFKEDHFFKKPILVVPIVVDGTRFKAISRTNNDRFISFCGNLFSEKDGVEILINAFAKISPRHLDFKLKLIGDLGNAKGPGNLKRLIDFLAINDKVVFTGYLNREEIPAHLMNSDILVLARPDNLQTQGGFPTKLGEYLATCRPVVVTAVGDITDYLKDGINAFIAIPGDVESFSQKLEYIIDNYSFAEKIGNEGHKLVDKEFNPGFQAARITEFLKGLAKNQN